MEASWHRVSTTLLGHRQDPGCMTVFFDYDLTDWTFGARFECDDCWFDLHVCLGPIRVSFCYWRQWPRPQAE